MLDSKIVKFVERLQSDIDTIHAESEHPFPTVMSFTKGKVYYKIWREYSESKSIYCFVDMYGNIWKASSYKAPAKNFIRGHIEEVTENGITAQHRFSYT